MQVKILILLFLVASTMCVPKPDCGLVTVGIQNAIFGDNKDNNVGCFNNTSTTTTGTSPDGGNKGEDKDCGGGNGGGDNGGGGNGGGGNGGGSDCGGGDCGGGDCGCSK